MNFPVYAGMLDQFKDSNEIVNYYEQGGLNGLEVILAGESDQGKIRPDMVNGVHLFFHIFWMDFWLRDFERLDKEFDSREQWIEFYGGMDRDAYLAPFRKDLEYAEKIGDKYVVFHVSEVTLRESFVYHYKYTNCRLRTPEDAVTYLHHMLDRHEKIGFPITDWIKGIHLQMSLGGKYKMKQKHEWKNYKNRLNFDEILFYDLYTLAYQHAENIDLHQPFLGEGVKELIERMDPKYVTFEFKYKSKEEYARFIKDQGELLGYVESR